MQKTKRQYNVGGVLLPRPFKVVRIGPVGLFVQDVGRSEEFYNEILGFVKTEEVSLEKAALCFYAHWHRASQPGTVCLGAEGRAWTEFTHQL
jgi:catechol 2,3-dioxygenase-like lactoylglutathione lyase family enzyme